MKYYMFLGHQEGYNFRRLLMKSADVTCMITIKTYWATRYQVPNMVLNDMAKLDQKWDKECSCLNI